MSDFLATVLAKAGLILLEALIVWLIRALVTHRKSAPTPSTAPVPIAA
jgi:hypothetical protein